MLGVEAVDSRVIGRLVADKDVRIGVPGYMAQNLGQAACAQLAGSTGAGHHLRESLYIDHVFSPPAAFGEA